ncbi:hypothetical protein ES705_32129 [subsurface metagenome]
MKNNNDYLLKEIIKTNPEEEKGYIYNFIKV